MGYSLLFVAVLLLWCCSTLGAAVTGPNSKKWYQHSVIYEIYPRSFYDSNGDGYGDLAGIKAKRDYLINLGVDAVWLTPIYKSPGKDGGYDISDYRVIDKRFGSMDDFEDMVDSFERKGIKIILDFVPNHSSDQHEWFQKSIEKIDPYTDYYIWKDPKGWDDENPIPPNNWAAIFSSDRPGSAWEWNEERQQFYYHSFMVEQPDLNLRNPAVVQELKDILKFWIDKGVKGFRFDAVPHLFEDANLRDNEGSSTNYTENLPETYAMVQELRAYLDALGKTNCEDYFMTVEAYCGQEETIKYYGTTRKPGAHFPFNFLLLSEVNGGTTAASLNNTISTYLNSLNEFQQPNWVSGNHDWPRIQSRFGSKIGVEIILILSLLLPGSATLYYGDDIGMDSYWGIDKTKCPPGVADDYRTPSRTPFQWSSRKHADEAIRLASVSGGKPSQSEAGAGFTTADDPWIPVNPDYYTKNVYRQNSTYCCCNKHDPPSTLIFFKTLMEQRKHPAFTNGNINTYVFDDYVFGFTRKFKDTLFLVMINLKGKSKTRVSSHLQMTRKIPDLEGATLIDTPLISNHYADKWNSRLSCPKNLMSPKHLTSPVLQMPAGSSFVLRYKLPS